MSIEIYNPEVLKKKELLNKFMRIKNDPIEFLKAVRTKDEVDQMNPIKHFPIHLEYLQWYVRMWQRERMIAIPKSRRMKMSWTNIALYLHDTMFNLGRHSAFVSKKEEDSDTLVKRAEFIYKHIDESILPRELLPAMESKYCTLSFPEIESKINGYPSGADQLRQHTFSGIMGDECAFWSDAQEMYKGAYPTTEGGGRLTMISSAAPGFFKRLVFDQLDTEGEFDAEAVVAGIRKQPMQGMTVWKNRKNKFFVVELHYTADPIKRDPVFKATMSSGMAKRDFDQEYEIQWDSFEGLPVYGEWNKRIHGHRGLQPIVGLPLLRGWDFGLTPACVVAQLQHETLVVLHEFTEFNMGAERFSTLVLQQCSVLFPNWGSGRKSNWIDFMDPAGVNRDQSDEGSCAKVLDSKGLEPIPGAVTFEDRRREVEKLLTKFTREGPSFKIDILTCPVLVRGFEGGYRYPDSVVGKEPNKLRPIKDEHSHPHDGLQYIATGISQKRRHRMTGSQMKQIKCRDATEMKNVH